MNSSNPAATSGSLHSGVQGNAASSGSSSNTPMLPAANPLASAPAPANLITAAQEKMQQKLQPALKKSPSLQTNLQLQNVARSWPRESMVEITIQTLVQELTCCTRASSVHLEQQQIATLQKYLAKQETRDSVYSQIMLKMESEQDVVVLLKCIYLIKGHISQFRPSILILWEMYCIMSHVKQKNLHTKLTSNFGFVLAAIDEKIAPNLQEDEKQMWYYLVRLTMDAQPNTILPISPTAALSPRKLITNVDIPDIHAQASASIYIKNFLLFRISSSPLHDKLTESKTVVSGGISATNTERDARSVLDSTLFGGQFRKITKFEDKKPEIDLSSCVRVEYPIKTRQQIMTVHNIKKKQQKRKHHHQISGLELPEFTIEQSVNDVSLDDKDLQNLFDRALDPNIAIREGATTQVLQLFCDLYRSGQSPAVGQIKSFFIEMLDSLCPEVRAHAFTILYNIFFNMVIGATPADRTSSNWIQTDLFAKFSDMSSYLLYRSEKDESVWNTSLSVYATMLINIISMNNTNDNICHITVPIYKLINIRILERYIRMLKVKQNNNQLHSLFIQVLMNILYKKEIRQNENARTVTVANLLISKVKSLEGDGIFFIIDQYLFSHSTEVKDNCFVLLFDYLIASIEARSNIYLDENQIHVLFHMLQTANSQYYFLQLFKYLPDRFVPNFSRFMFIDLLLRQRTLSFFKPYIDQFTIVSFVVELHSLAAVYLSMENEFLVQCQRVVTTQNSSSRKHLAKLIQTVQTLLIDATSSDEIKNGEAILFAFLKANEEAQLGVRVKEQMDHVITQIANHKLPSIRILYLNAVEKLLLLHRSRFQQHGDTDRSKMMMKVFNESLMKFVHTKERSVLVLLRIFYMIMDFFGVYTSSQDEINETTIKSDTMSSFDEKLENGKTHAFQVLQHDDMVDMFLSGRLCVPFYLLKDISISILHYLFTQLGEQNCVYTPTPPSDNLRRTAQDARAILLLFIIEKCRNRAVLDSIGGLSFFRSLLDEEHSAIALFASKYLMKQLSVMAPEQYYSLLNQVIKKAQVKHSPQLLENPYLQLTFKMNE